MLEVNIVLLVCLKFVKFLLVDMIVLLFWDVYVI